MITSLWELLPPFGPGALYPPAPPGPSMTLSADSVTIRPQAPSPNATLAPLPVTTLVRFQPPLPPTPLVEYVPSLPLVKYVPPRPPFPLVGSTSVPTPPIRPNPFCYPRPQPVAPVATSTQRVHPPPFVRRNPPRTRSTAPIVAPAPQAYTPMGRGPPRPLPDARILPPIPSIPQHPWVPPSQGSGSRYRAWLFEGSIPDWASSVAASAPKTVEITTGRFASRAGRWKNFREGRGVFLSQFLLERLGSTAPGVRGLFDNRKAFVATSIEHVAFSTALKLFYDFLPRMPAHDCPDRSAMRAVAQAGITTAYFDDILTVAAAWELVVGLVGEGFSDVLDSFNVMVWVCWGTDVGAGALLPPPNPLNWGDCKCMCCSQMRRAFAEEGGSTGKKRKRKK